eukprot:sb/3478716/
MRLKNSQALHYLQPKESVGRKQQNLAYATGPFIKLRCGAAVQKRGLQRIPTTKSAFLFGESFLQEIYFLKTRAAHLGSFWQTLKSENVKIWVPFIANNS